MSAGKWVLWALAVVYAAAAGLSYLPYGWAHLAAGSLTAAVGAWTAFLGTVAHAADKQAAKGASHEADV